jgi:pyrroline-5-carboxylate reductase
MTRIAIIGAGNVGGALFRCLAKVFSEDELILCDAIGEQLARFGARHVTRDPNEALQGAEVMIVAVKPQSFAELAQDITVAIRDQLIISIMAGVRLQAVASTLRCDSVIRAMPNLGAQIGRSTTAWVASPACTRQQIGLARRIFLAAGTEIEVRDEALLDAFTALAGSGPAYFFHLADLLARNAVAMGFDEKQAVAIAREVLGASSALLDAGDRTAEEWKRAVSTQGGTTDAALLAMEERGFSEAFSAGLQAAKKRSEELN